MSSVLVLGAGLVAPPHVRHLLGAGLGVTVADVDGERAEAVVAGHPAGRAVALDATAEADRLRRLVADHDVVVSLLPWTLHPLVAGTCVAVGRSLVTTSYVGDAMRALDAPARAAGVLLLNECGLDPGIDHMTAVRLIHRVRARGGTVTSFTSCCGGLPAPEAADNPLGYKFSWSPRGVLLASRSPARFRRAGRTVEVPGDALFDARWRDVARVEGSDLELEGYPNRDSLPYLEHYRFDPADTLLRGTLRYPGWCAVMAAVGRVGWLDPEPHPRLPGATAGQLTARLLGSSGLSGLTHRVAGRLGLAPGALELAAVEWLGLLGDDELPGDAGSPLGALTQLMLARMQYRPGERDMVILEHRLEVAFGDRREAVTATLTAFGEPHGDTAMARTVGLPAAVAARLLADGAIRTTGVAVPVLPELYEPILAELEHLGVTMDEVVSEP